MDIPTFHEGVEIPEALCKLVSFASNRNDFYAGSFDVYGNGVNELPIWFGENQDAISQLAVFGSNSDGSLYALWLYGSQPANQAPVVFLGSEGVSNRVIASNLIEFIQLLMLGIDDLGFLVDQPGWPTKNRRRDAQAFREWALRELGIDLHNDPEQLVQKAQAAHPDFAAWMDVQCSKAL